jgi:protein-L-isoaspartate(D-aspartate) O-methyltransferase
MTAEPRILADVRTAYAHATMRLADTNDTAVEAAFAKVPRETFLGPPPWRIGSGCHDGWISCTDPGELYQDRLVALDLGKGLNNGQPSLHAKCIAALRLTKHDHVLHAGAGTGYYTAILAELADSVDAYEVEPDLAARAMKCLAPWPNVTVRPESAAGHELPAADAIYVSAGATHPDPFWLDALRDGGRLLFPLTGEDQSGYMLLIRRAGAHFAAHFVCGCGFIDGVGLRDPVTAARLSRVFHDGGEAEVRSLTRHAPASPTIWFAGDGWYLSTEPSS